MHAYLIREGDSLESIAAYFRLDPELLAKTNSALIVSNKIKAGHFLLLPAGPTDALESLHAFLARRNYALFGGHVDDPGWLQTAWREEGQREIEPGANARILEYLASVTTLPTELSQSDETAWCACFAQWCYAQVGIGGKNSARAIRWNEWGRECDPTRGSLAVFERWERRRLVGGHVGFFLEDRGDQILVLGGNQSQSVSQAEYPKNGLKGNYKYVVLSYRCPP